MRSLKIFLIPAALSLPLAALAAGSDVSLPNPIACDNLICLFLSVIRLVLAAIGLFGLVMFIWGGFLMLTSGGNEEQIKKGKETLTWASLGIVVVLGSWVLLRYVLTVLTNVTA